METLRLFGFQLFSLSMLIMVASLPFMVANLVGAIKTKLGFVMAGLGFVMAGFSLPAMLFAFMAMARPIEVAISFQVLSASALLCIAVIALRLRPRVDSESLFAILSLDDLLLKITLIWLWPIALVVIAKPAEVWPFSSILAIGIMFAAIGFLISSLPLLFVNRNRFAAVIFSAVSIAISTGIGLTLMIYQSHGFAISLLGLVPLTLTIVASIKVAKICKSEMYVTLSWVLDLGGEGRISQLFLCLIAFLLTLFSTLLGSHALILRLGAG